MCGRFNLRTNSAELGKLLDALPDEQYAALLQRFNIAPTQTILAVRLADDTREAVPFRWGLIPSWAKDAKIGGRLINPRADTVAVKPSFRSAFKRRRCLIPASGYYEWRGTKPPKQPFHIHRPGDGVIAFAGLWERWEPPDGDPVESCSIITTDANQTLTEVHNRMPVILGPR